MPSSVPLLGNFAESVTHRPNWSTFGPWLPGHWYQKSSTFTYWKPTAARPLLAIASAWASIVWAVGLWRTKLQLLQPSAGVCPTPLSSALAVAVPDTSTVPVRSDRAARQRISLCIGTPRTATATATQCHSGIAAGDTSPHRVPEIRMYSGAHA